MTQEPKKQQTLSDPCPIVTVDGKEYCLNEICRVRGIQGVKCPPIMPDGALPDLLIGWEPGSFLQARRDGVWNKE
jgi:hypothetical protein